MPTDNDDTHVHDTYPIGCKVLVGHECLSNPKGTVGVVYEHYTLNNFNLGFSVIFPNGSYDGFSDVCSKVFDVNPMGVCESLSDYVFENVGKLSSDFKSGLFNVGFAI